MIIRWANELTGKNSKTPWIAAKIKISTEESIKWHYCIAAMQYKWQICLIFLIISQLYCPINAFRVVYVDIKPFDIGKKYAWKNA